MALVWIILVNLLVFTKSYNFGFFDQNQQFAMQANAWYPVIKCPFIGYCFYPQNEHPGRCPPVIKMHFTIERSQTQHLECFSDRSCASWCKCCNFSWYQHKICLPALPNELVPDQSSTTTISTPVTTTTDWNVQITTARPTTTAPETTTTRTTTKHTTTTVYTTPTTRTTTEPSTVQTTINVNEIL